MTSDSIEVSLIISVYGQLEHTKRCLLEIDKTLKNDISYEVLIVDYASKDGMPKFLRSLDSRYRTFYNETNKGFAQNNNFATKQAHGKYLYFLNHDVFVQGNWLLPMLEVFKPRKRSEWWEMFSNLQIQEDMTIWEWFFLHKEFHVITGKVFLSTI